MSIKSVVIDGVRYVPLEHKIPEEAIRLLQEIVAEAVRDSGVYIKGSRLRYLLTDGSGRAR